MPTKTKLELNLIAALTAVVGIITLSSTLEAIIHRHSFRLAVADASVTVTAGISLIYLALLLRRGKYNAWAISLPVYIYLLIRNYRHFVIDLHNRERPLHALLNLLLPAIVLLLLALFRKQFAVRSETRSFLLAAGRAVIILAVAFVYGITGFSLMDDRDFHREISIGTAAHYTIDQFNLTTNGDVVPYTKRAWVFLDSLAAVSLVSVGYAAVSFFAPIRFRLRHSRRDYREAVDVLRRYTLTSEDFFKLWPTDKAYFFSRDRQAVIAYKVVGGVALGVGDPIGPKNQLRRLVLDFADYCRLNDWSPTFIHTGAANLKLFEKTGFSAQKIGQEALIDIKRFNRQPVKSKYFRHIASKFTKLQYVFEIVPPPHSGELLAELKGLSDDWLERPGRTERGFMMGYYDETYLQLCDLCLVKDSGGRIQAFLNRLPDIKKNEANYDLLRQSAGAPGNINDFLIINLLNELETRGYNRLNMGLSPLSGLGRRDSPDRTALDSLLHFVYSNAGRFYSFQGLARFKSKYEPDWEDRYIIYRGGVPGLSRVLNAQLRAMKK